MGILDRLLIYGSTVLLLVAIAGAVYGRYEWIVRENEKSKQQLIQSREQTKQIADVANANAAAFDALNKRFDNLDKLMAERAQREQRLSAAISGVRKDLNGLKKTDPVVQSWSEQPLPDAISERLRGDPAAPQGGGAQGEGKGEAAGSPPKPLPGAAVVGAIKRGLVRVHPGAAPAASGVQQAPR